MTYHSLACTQDGSPDAPVLVLSSSLGTTCDMWDPQVEGLARDWRVIRFDHPGHGASPVWDGPVTVAAIGQAILAALDGLGVDRMSFCGLSLGGAIGQWLAAHAPERVERLVLCSTSARFPGPDAYLQRAVTVRAQGMSSVSGTVLERWFTPGFRAREPEVIERYRSMLEATPPEGYAACCEAVAAFDSRADLPTVVAPTLIVVGRQDPVTTLEHAQMLAAGIPRARLVTIDGAAHLVNVEQPAAVEAAILDHLRGAE